MAGSRNCCKILPGHGIILKPKILGTMMATPMEIPTHLRCYIGALISSNSLGERVTDDTNDMDVDSHTFCTSRGRRRQEFARYRMSAGL